ncbi:MAG: hypothetical protein B0D85_06330 [Candidatus Sedimenticola endophacoides]|nr:MAG: hypothetical protein B0D85_06330 [Candidatus Sedimenticola endophacoides]
MIEMVDLRDGEADVRVDALFEQTYVDRRVLADRIKRLLQRQGQVSLSQLLARYPVEKGVAEVLGYLSLAADDPKSMIDSANEERLNITDEQGRQKQVRLPTVVYTR